MIQLGTVHLMLGRNEDLECGSFWEGWSYGRAWDVLCGLIVLWIVLGIGILDQVGIWCLGVEGGRILVQILGWWSCLSVLGCGGICGGLFGSGEGVL